MDRIEKNNNYFSLELEGSNNLEISPLIERDYDRKKREVGRMKICDRFKNWARPSVQTCQRAVFLNGDVSPPNYMENLIRNQKYSVITFLPLVLFDQFKFFYNLFYLFLSITQFYPPLSVGRFWFLAFFKR